MNGRFPGDSITRTDDQPLDDQTIPTLAAAPPSPVRYTFALYKSPSFSTPELSTLVLKGKEPKSSVTALKRNNIFAGWRDKLQVNIRPFRSKTPPPPQIFAPLDITVHSFYIEQFLPGSYSRPGILIAQIDLNDRQAVEQAKDKPLLSVHKDDAW
ncbi:hypothetical protein FRC01_011155, partial [Tulasnella sp. 417]